MNQQRALATIGSASKRINARSVIFDVAFRGCGVASWNCLLPEVIGGEHHFQVEIYLQDSKVKNRIFFRSFIHQICNGSTASATNGSGGFMRCSFQK